MRVALALGAMVVAAGCATPTPVERALEENAGALRAPRSVAGQLRLACTPAEATVVLDGVPQGSCSEFASEGLRLGEALHVVEVQKAGFATYRVEIQAGQARTSLKVDLAPTN